MNQPTVDLKAELEQRKMMEIQVAMEAENNRCNFARQYVFTRCTQANHIRPNDVNDWFDLGYTAACRVDELVSAKLKIVADSLNPRVLS